MAWWLAMQTTPTEMVVLAQRLRRLADEIDPEQRSADLAAWADEKVAASGHMRATASDLLLIAQQREGGQ